MPPLNLVTRFGHLFTDRDDQYLFVKNLGRGASSRAQLVLHCQSGELRVRKVSLRYLDENDIKVEDREKVLFYLQEQAAKKRLQPNISHLFSASDVLASPSQESGRNLWSRVQYMKYYNGGNIGQLYDKWRNSGLAMPSSLILKLLTQIVSALYFISSHGVLHADLHDENMFVHHEGGRAQSYIGDFGLAERGALTDPMNSFTDDACMLHMSLKKWMKAGQPVRETDALRQYLLDVVEPILFDLGATRSDRLPDLEELLDVLQNAPEGPPEPLTDRFASEVPDWQLPLYHATEEAALDADAVAGPWHLAKVSINIWTNDTTVVGVSSETYDNKEIWDESMSDAEYGYASDVSMYSFSST